MLLVRSRTTVSRFLQLRSLASVPSSPPLVPTASSPSVPYPEKYNRTAADKKLLNHTNEESIVSPFHPAIDSFFFFFAPVRRIFARVKILNDELRGRRMLTLLRTTEIANQKTRVISLFCDCLVDLTHFHSFIDSTSSESIVVMLLNWSASFLLRKSMVTWPFVMVAVDRWVIP